MRDVARLPVPKAVDGTPQVPIEGMNMIYTFDEARTTSRHTTQYFEIFGNRAIYHEGWLASTVHWVP
jgi:arylsulfatase